MKRNLLLSAIFIACICPLSVHAQLEVTKTQEHYRITGTNFGTAPGVVLHEDFDTGEQGQKLLNWSLSGTAPTYNNKDPVTGKLTGMSRFIGTNYNASAEFKQLGGLTTVYLSYYFKVVHLNGARSRNIKLARLSGGYNGTYIQATGLTLFHGHSNGIFITATTDAGNATNPQVWTDNYADGKWHRAEYYVVLSSPAGASNGTSRLIIDGTVVANFENVITERTGKKFEWLTLPYYVAHDAGGDYEIHYDNVVVSKNRARVELCAESKYLQCARPIVADGVAWSNNAVTLNLAAIDKEKKQYAYVFKSDGSLINTNGIAVCPNCPSPPFVD